MRPALLLLLLLCACSTPSGEAPEEEPPSEPPPPPESRGGVRVQLGGHGGELVLHRHGEVHFHFDEVLSAGVTVRVPVGEDEPRAVALTYRDRVQGYIAHEVLTIEPGEAQILTVIEQHPHRATVQVTRVLPEPREGGSVLAVGEDAIEVGVTIEGGVRARMFESDSHAHEITVTVRDDEGHPHPVPLAWSDEEEAYVGSAAGLEPASGSLEVIVETEGAVARGRGTLWALDMTGVSEAGEEGAGQGAADPNTDPNALRLEMPELGSNLPTVIAVPPDSEAAEPPSANPP